MALSPGAGRESAFGAWLDPAADKLLMLLCFGALFFIGMTPMCWWRWWWPAIWRLLAAGSRSSCSAVHRHPAAVHRQGLHPVQVLYIFAALFLLAFDLSAPRLTQLAAWACGF